MSAMSNDPYKLARAAGYYKVSPYLGPTQTKADEQGLQSAGAAVSFGVDAAKVAYLTELLVSWVMVLVSLGLCAMVLYTTTDTNYDIEHTVKVHDKDAPVTHVAEPEHLSRPDSSLSDPKKDADVAVREV